MGRYLITFFAVQVAVIGGAWIWIAQWPMSFFDPAYAVLQAKMDMARHLPPDSVVILGDSRAKAELIPAQLGPDTYNLALDGATSIELSALARILLSSPHPPRAVILSISPYDCMVSRTFWEWVKFRLFDWASLEEIRARSRRFNAPVLHFITDPDFEHVAPLFGPERPGDAEAKLNIALWSLHFPSLDFYSLAGGVLLGRKHANIEADRAIRESRGYHSIGSTAGTRELCWETRMPTFTPSPLLDSYFSDIVARFQGKGIPVYFIAAPFNELSYNALHPGYATAYTGYIKSYERRYSNFHQLGEPFPTRPWVDFGDADHLNSQAAIQFSGQVAGLLKQAGVEK